MLFSPPQIDSIHSQMQALRSWRIQLPSIAFYQTPGRIGCNIQIRALNMAAATSTPILRPRDPNTLSNYTAWRSRHITANFEIDFNNKRLTGNVIHQLLSKTQAETREILLDTSFLDISQVKVDGQTAHWELLPRFEPYGSALKIVLETGVAEGNTVEVDVRLLSTYRWMMA